MSREEFYSKYMYKHMKKYNNLGYSIEWNNRYAEIEEKEEKAWKAFKKTKPNKQ
jgi:ABC-type sugar transport system ATPase subunit